MANQQTICHSDYDNVLHTVHTALTIINWTSIILRTTMELWNPFEDKLTWHLLIVFTNSINHHNNNDDIFILLCTTKYITINHDACSIHFSLWRAVNFIYCGSYKNPNGNFNNIHPQLHPQPNQYNLVLLTLPCHDCQRKKFYWATEDQRSLLHQKWLECDWNGVD